MAFSLSNWFKGKPDASGEESDEDQAVQTPVSAPAPTAPAPPSVRTATPNAASAKPPAAPVSLRTATPAGRRTVSVPPAKLPVSSKVTPSLAAARKVAFPPGATPAPNAPVTMRPAPTFPSAAPAPKAPDMTVSLEVGDFLDRLPASLVQAGSFDRQKKVDFQASELYSDLSKGRASVPASVIYQRCPEIFARPVTETEDMEVPLPLRKLVEQMGTALSTRADQVEEENVGQIETPFLQVAMEDNARLPAANGSSAGAVRPMQPLASTADAQSGPSPTRPHRTGQISTISPLKTAPEQIVAPPTAASSGPIIPGKRPPSTVRASVAGGKIRLSGPAAVNRMSPVTHPESPDGKPRSGTHSQRINLPVTPTSPSHQVAKKTARIQIPPISLRPGGPNATPRTGPTPPRPEATPVTEGTANLRPAVGKEAPPAPPPITFRTSPPPPTARPVPSSFAPPRGSAFPPPAFPAIPPTASAPSVPQTTAAPDDRKIELGLAAILRSVPSSMLAVEPSSVPDDVRVSLPFALVEPQLSQGRVSIPRETFIQALPEAHRQVLSADTEASDIPLPLQEVFQHLPTNALTIRADQMAEETGSHYPTPFSQKADEDAQRFNTAVPVPPPVNESAATAEADTVADLPLDQDSTPVDPARDVPLDEAEPPAPAAEAQPAAESAISSPEPARDIPLDKVETPALSFDAQPPVEAVTEPTRDIPLDLQNDAPAETIPTSSLPVIDVPVEPQTVTPPTPAAAISDPVADEESVVEPQPLPPLTVIETPVEEAPVAEKTEEAAIESPAVPVPVKEAPILRDRPVVAPDSTLQTLFMTEEELDAKVIVKLVCQLPGVNGCTVMFEDGLRLAGNFPDGDTEGFSAMAAPFYKRAVRFVSELELGQLHALTLHTGTELLSFFMHGSICVSVRHTGRGFLPGVREKIEIVTLELARMYSTSNPASTAE